MSLSLNGTSQYVSLGTALNIYKTRPFTVAAVYSADAWVNGVKYGIYSQGNNNSGSGASWHLYRNSTNVNRYTWWTNTTTSRDAATSAGILTGTGWHLLIASHRISGANSEGWIGDYAYTDATWVTGSISSSQGEPTAPGASDLTMIGATQLASIANFFKGLISWVAIWNYDLTNGGNTAASDVIELRDNGAWNLNNSSCKLFIAFNNTAVDQSSGGHNGTLVGSPSYDTAGPGEIAPAGGSDRTPGGIYVPRVRHKQRTRF